MYRKLKRVWSHNHFNYIPNFRETFPELNKISSEELCNRFAELGVDFYTEEKVAVSFWIRLTLPFALLTIVLMIVGLPITFLFTGKWGYPFNDKNYIHNWFKSLRLLS
jgi:hypothetical protein